MKRIFKITGILLSLFVLMVAAALIYLNTAYPNVDPPTNVKINATPEMFSRGEYIAKHVAVCIDCHSERDFSRFSGPIKPGTEGKGGALFDEKDGIPGKIYSKNITPDGIGKWSDGELIRAITMGVDKDGKALFPIMPYMNYNQMTEEDLYSLITYIKTLNPVEGSYPEKELNFPLNHIVKTMPIKSYNPSKVEKSNTIEYGKYLVSLASCGDCHTPMKEGEPVIGMEFSGGNEMKLPFGTLRASNITPERETGIGAWTKEIFIAKFKSYDPAIHGERELNPGEFNSIMPWSMYAGMTEEDLGAIYDYLRTLKPIRNQVVRFTPNNHQ
jgi:mono/diheme cytochrome c family protein